MNDWFFRIVDTFFRSSIKNVAKNGVKFVSVANFVTANMRKLVKSDIDKHIFIVIFSVFIKET